MTELTKQLELAVAKLDRQFGKGSVIRLGDDIEPWPSISTGALSLDMALGIGGLPLGRMVELYGAEGVGKSSVCLSVVANAQRMGYRCLYVDAEHALDPNYARALGVNLEDLLLSQPSTGEEAIDVLETIVRTGDIKVAIVDSVAALVPRAELEGEMGDAHMGLQPRLMAKTMRKIVGPANETKTLVVFTNQLREKVGIPFGNPITQPGGRALKFAASVRIELKRVEDLQDKSNGSMSGLRVKARIVKNKMAPPLREGSFNIDYGKGINNIRCVLDLAEEFGIIQRNKSWYYYGDQIIGQGADKAVEHLASDLDLFEKIREEIAV